MTQVIAYRLEGLHCVGCTKKILAALHSEYSGSAWEFSMATGVLEGKGVTEDNLRVAIQTIVNRYESGVFVLPMSDDGSEPESVTVQVTGWERFYNRTLRLFLGGTVFVAGLLLDGLGFAAEWGIENFVTLIFLAAYLFVGTPVIVRAVRNTLKGEWFDENFLMSIATFGAIVLGEMPEALGVMLFYELGEYFQGRAVDQSRRAIEKLLAIRPDTAHLVVDGKTFDVPSRQLAVGDVIIVKPGERMPTDATLLSPVAYVDASALTGESKPVTLGKGDSVLGGYINLEQVLQCRVEKPFAESTASRLIQLVQQAADKKARPEQFMTRFARYYTPIVILLSALTAVIPPLFFGQSFDVWLYRALIFLVISCPCALVISIPLSYFGGIGAASKSGVLVKGGNYLEALAQIKSVYFDKTGTLTEGKFQVSEIRTYNAVTQETLLAYAAAAEQHSTHPIATAIREAAAQHQLSWPESAEIQELAGEGVVLKHSDGMVRVGKAGLIREVLELKQRLHLESAEAELSQARGKGVNTVVHVALEGHYLGWLTLSDKAKASSKGTVDKLRAMGIEVTLLSGDRQETVTALASEMGIEKAFGNLKPSDKLMHLEQALKRSDDGQKIAFVGDGINDAPVIARADVGIAMGGVGSEAAIEAADVVLMRDEPQALISAIQLAKRTRGIVYQNIVMALGIKILFLGLGVVGLSGMWEAIFADVGVALLAVFNAMRLLPREST